MRTPSLTMSEAWSPLLSMACPFPYLLSATACCSSRRIKRSQADAAVGCLMDDDLAGWEWPGSCLFFVEDPERVL